METNHERAGNIAAKRSCTKKKAFRGRYFIKIEGRENTPAHKFQIEVDRLVGQSNHISALWLNCIHLTREKQNGQKSSPFRIHHGCQISYPRSQLSHYILFPSDSTRLRLCVYFTGSSAKDSKSAFPCSCVGRELGVTPAEDTIAGGRMENTKVSEEVAKRPAWVIGYRRGV